MGGSSYLHRTRRPQMITSMLLWALFTSTTFAQTSNFFQSLCANFNTGTGDQQASSDFMSNGKCHDACSGYAYAIVQYQSCWCSNVAPGGAGPGSNCNVPCPGFPEEKCGDKSQGLYGYIALGPAASSTSSPGVASTAAAATSASPSQTQDSANQASSFQSQVTVQATVTQTPTVQTLVISLTQTPSTASPATQTVSVSVTPSTSSTSTSTTPTSTWTPTPVMTVETVTGVLRTLTVTPTEVPAQETQTVLAQASNNSGGFFSSPGKVAGTFVAVAIVIVAIIAGLMFFFWRRRRRDGSEHLPSVAGSLSGTPQRRPSRMSSMGLLGSQREKNTVLPPIQTASGDWGTGASAEKSPADTLDKRSSYPHVTDQRLEPTAVWNPLHDNGSHVSVRSFRDDQDYSRRMLRVANPD